MPRSKQDISYSAIEKEIYNTFAQFKEQKNIKIADLINKLEHIPQNEQPYRKIKFTYDSLFKLILFQRLKGIKFHTKLTKYLRRNPSEKFKLGFSETPDKTQVGYFINHILDNNSKELIEFIAKKIEEISEKFGILLDVRTFVPEKPTNDTKERNLRLQKNEKTVEICRFFKKRVAPFINLHQNHNAVYKKNELIELLIHLGLSQDFAENGSRIFKELRKHGPDADTLLYHLKNTRTSANFKTCSTPCLKSSGTWQSKQTCSTS